MMLKASLIVIAPVIMVCSAQGSIVTPTKANGDFIAGIGIPSDNFKMGSNRSVFLKARGRDSGQPLSIGIHGDTYHVAGGAAASDPSASWWNFDFQFAPQDTLDLNYVLTLQLDTDPSAATSFVNIKAPILDADSNPLNSWDDTDGFHVNPGGGAWSDDTTRWVVSQSWRPDFSFLAGSILGPGNYQIRLTAQFIGTLPPKSPSFNDQTTITVIVDPVLIPLPSAAGMGLIGMLGLMGVRRRRAGYRAAV